MPRWIALLRGINVGGGTSVPMAPLRHALLEHAQIRNLQTYIQSGNLIFESPLRTAGTLATIIGLTIEQHHGFRPRVMVLRSTAFRESIEQNPYPEAISQPKALHFFFLDAKPLHPDLPALSNLKTSTERFQLLGRVFYMCTPDGFGKSKLAEKVEKHLGVPATARNYSTVQAIWELASG